MIIISIIPTVHRGADADLRLPGRSFILQRPALKERGYVRYENPFRLDVDFLDRTKMIGQRWLRITSTQDRVWERYRVLYGITFAGALIV